MKKSAPTRQLSEIYNSLIMTEFCKSEDLAHSLAAMQFGNLQNFASQIFDRRSIEAFVGGNCTEVEGLDALGMVKSILGGNSCESNEVIPSKFKHQTATRPIIRNVNLDVSGNGLLWALHVGDRTDSSSCGTDILAKLFKEPFYSELRTKQQVGYIVSSGQLQFDKQLMLNAVIQSNVYDPRDLLARVELFVEEFLRDLKESKEIPNRFESIKKSTLPRLLNPFDTLSGKLNYYSYLAFQENGDYGFLRRRHDTLQEYKLEYLQQFAELILQKSNVKRMAILGQGNTPENSQYSYQTIS